MTFLVSAQEPPPIAAIGTTSSVPEQWGADVMIVTEVAGLIGVQRKQFPEDFLSSLYDGRLASSLTKLSQLPMSILLLEGRPSWTFNGALTGYDRPGGANFTQTTLRSLCWSAQHELGVATHWTTGISDTLDFLRDLRRWGDKTHDALGHRPNQPRVEGVRQISARDRATWILQGIDGVGPQVAGAIVDRFGGLPLEWTVTEAELATVPGVGKGRVGKMVRDIAAKEETTP